MGIGSKLQKLIESKGITVAHLSRVTGVNQKTIYSIIQRDNMKADLSTLQRLSNELGVKIEYFLDSDDDFLSINNETYEDDEGLRIIERARQKMDKRDKERMIRVLKAAFEEEFGDEDDHSS